MEIHITGTPKEIAALVLAVQERQGKSVSIEEMYMPTDPESFVSHGLENGLKSE